MYCCDIFKLKPYSSNKKSALLYSVKISRNLHCFRAIRILKYVKTSEKNPKFFVLFYAA